MTREEAKKWLESLRIKDFGWDDYAMQESQKEIRERCENALLEAIDIAIKSLSDEAKTSEMSVNVEYDVEYLPDKDGVHQAKATIKSGYIQMADDTDCPSYTTTSAQSEPSGDLISRADAIDTIEYWYGIDVSEAINRLPSADSPKGKWIIRNDMPKLDNTYSIECSKCGQLMFGHYNADNPNYCPNCGADMQLDK